MGALAAAGAGVFAAKFLGGAVTAASDLAENQSKVGVVFGKSAGQIIAASKNSATAIGLSQSAYLGATGSLGNLLVSLDIAPKKAAGMSQQMVKLAGDLASFNNVPVEEALAAIQSGLTGETEPLKKFGVNMNDATLKNQALKLGLIKTTKEALTPQAKALAAQALIMKQTGTAQGDFARTSGGLANQQRILAAQFDNVKATVGTALLPVVTRFVSFINASVLPAITGFIAGIKNGSGAGGQFASAVRGVGSTLASVAGFIRQNIAVIGPLVAALLGGLVAFKAITTAVRIFTAVQAALNFVLAANPIGIVIVAIAALVAGLIYAYKHSQTFRNIVNAAFAAVRSVVASVIGWFGKYVPAIFRAVVGYVKGYVNVYRTVITAAFNVARRVVTVAVGIIRSVVTTAFAVVRSVVSAAGGVVRGAMNIVKGAFSLAGRGAGVMANLIKTGVGKAIGFVRDLPGKAKSALGDLLGVLKSKGADLIQGLINGITGKINDAVQAVKNGLTKIRNMLPGSPIKEGPLKPWNNTGRTGPGGQLVGRIISGVDSQSGALRASMAGLTSGIVLPTPRVASSAFGSPALGGAGGSGRALVNIGTMVTHDPAEAAYRLRLEQTKALALAGTP